jgi:hypothetical protein
MQLNTETWNVGDFLARPFRVRLRRAAGGGGIAIAMYSVKSWRWLGVFLFLFFFSGGFMESGIGRLPFFSGPALRLD